jgi:hypothetical protein
MNQSTAEKKWLDGQGGAEDHGRRELAGGAGTEEAETPQALMKCVLLKRLRVEPREREERHA